VCVCVCVCVGEREGEAEREKGDVQSIDYSNHSRHKNTKRDNALADRTSASALFSRVIGGLAGKGGQPDDGKNCVEEQHGVGFGEAASALPARSANEVDPGRD